MWQIAATARLQATLTYSSCMPATRHDPLADGLTALARSQFDLAELRLRQALTHCDQRGLARVALGRALAGQGRLAEARTTFSLALAESTRTHKGATVGEMRGMLLDLALAQQHVHDYAASLKTLARMLKIQPASARAHHLHALALDAMGQTDAALAAARRACELAGRAPGAANASLLLATLEARSGAPDIARARLSDIPLASAEGPRARFELGRIEAHAGHIHVAHACLAEAGQQTLQRPPVSGYDLDAVYRELARDAALAANWPWSADAPDPLPAPAFLMGFYRCGTTLLEQRLAAHPDLFTSDEADLLPFVLRAAGSDWPLRLRDDTLRRALRARYRERAQQIFGAALHGRLLIDKTALNTVNLAFVHALFPEAKLIFAVRDPRDACVSAFQQAFRPNPLSAQWLDWDRGVRFCAAVLGHALALQRALPLNSLTVRYEDVVADAAGQTARVFAHLDVNPAAPLADYRQAAASRALATPSRVDVAKPVYRDALERWRPWATHFSAHHERLAPLLEAWAYPPFDTPSA